MKRMLSMVMILLCLCGCSDRTSHMNQALTLRKIVQNADGCTFSSVITSDYGDKAYSFSMDCKADDTGKVTFTVTSPETISGISGTLSDGEGKLTFDKQALVFEMLADGQVSPVSIPWLFMHTLRSGYIRSCGAIHQGLLIQIDDSYREDALQLNIRTDEKNLPISAEIFWQGRRIASMTVENFTIL